MLCKFICRVKRWSLTSGIYKDTGYSSLPLQIPLGMSEFSATPPHRDRVTSGRSLGVSDRLSVPLSTAPLPTDWGEWDTERRPASSQCLGSCSGSLQGGNHTGYWDGIHCCWLAGESSSKFEVTLKNFVGFGTFWGSSGRRPLAPGRSGHPGRCLQVPGVGSSWSHLYSVAETRQETVVC